MAQKRLRDLNPDGLVIRIPWFEMEVGDSCFIPCVNVELARVQLRTLSRDYGIPCTTRVRVEAGILGLRLWRTT